jgi:hypothetical protein
MMSQVSTLSRYCRIQTLYSDPHSSYIPIHRPLVCQTQTPLVSPSTHQNADSALCVKMRPVHVRADLRGLTPAQLELVYRQMEKSFKTPLGQFFCRIEVHSSTSPLGFFWGGGWEGREDEGGGGQQRNFPNRSGISTPTFTHGPAVSMHSCLMPLQGSMQQTEWKRSVVTGR